MADLVTHAMTELTGDLNHGRTMTRLLDLVTGELSDRAMLAVTDSRRMGFTLAGWESGVSERMFPLGTQESVHLERAAATGVAQRLPVAPDTDLAGLVPSHHDAEMRPSAPGELLLQPLNARGVDVGVLVLVREGRDFDDDAVRSLEQISRLGAAALEAARLYEERAGVSALLAHSLRPPALPDFSSLRLSAGFRPSAEHLEFGGDFYDVHGDEDDCLVVLGDVCGKGVEAAVLNGRARQSLRTAALFDLAPASVLGALNQALFEPGNTRFVTVVAARLRREGSSRRIDIAVAGHEPPLLIRADGAIERPEAIGPLSGIFPGAPAYAETSAELRSGDTLLLFSDGLTEAAARNGTRFGDARLASLASSYAGLAPTALCQAIEQEVVDHVAGGGHDDMTMVAVQVP